jgi:hypothetical protein
LRRWHAASALARRGGELSDRHGRARASAVCRFGQPNAEALP